MNSHRHPFIEPAPRVPWLMVAACTAMVAMAFGAINNIAVFLMPLGIESAGGALGQGVMPFLARQLVLAQGWRAAYAPLGVLYLVVMLPLALWMRNPPRRAPLAAAASVPRHTPAASPAWLLAWLCVAVTFCCVCMGTPIVHVASLGSDMGLGERESAGLLAVMMVCGMAGRAGLRRP